MADLSKIKLNGTIYNFKDTKAREEFSTNINGVALYNSSLNRFLVSDNTTISQGIIWNKLFVVVSTQISSFNNLYVSKYSEPTVGSAFWNIVYIDDTSVKSIPAGIYLLVNMPTAGVVKLKSIPSNSDVNSLIATAIEDINSFEVSIVNELPSSDINTHTIYFISNSGSNPNSYDEYMYINSNWEKIGTTDIDLSNYLQKTDIADWAKENTKPTYTASEIGAIADTEPAASITQTNINNWTKASNLFTVSSDHSGNDYWWKLKINRSSLFAFSNAPGGNGYLRSIDLPVNEGSAYATIQFPTTSGKLALVSDISSIVPAWARATNKPTYTASEVGALPATTVIPTIPTDVSAFNNDAGYLTSFTETDPTVPAWAKAATKPTYTASEVGALPATTVIPDITGKVDKAGDTMTGFLTFDDHNSGIVFRYESTSTINSKLYSVGLDGSTPIVGFDISTRFRNISSPTVNTDAANKKYVDDKFSSITDTNTTYSLSISGNRITLTPSSGSATYVDLPVYDGGII